MKSVDAPRHNKVSTAKVPLTMVPVITSTHAASGVTNTSGIYALSREQVPGRSEEADGATGATGRGVFFRPHRYSREDLVARVRRYAELAVRANRMTLDETRSLLRIYEEGLSGYTYLESGV